MPKTGLTEIICIIDKSGSMASMKQDAIGAFNNFLEMQRKQPGEAKLTLTLFDTEYELRHNGLPIKDVPDLTSVTYQTNGFTALLDAIGKTVDEVGVRLSKTLETDMPEKVIVVILTDGDENSSKEYTHSQVMEKITHQRDTYKWEFVFLAANQDAIKTGEAMGIKHNFAYVATSGGTRDVMGVMAAAVSDYRASGKVDMDTYH